MRDKKHFLPPAVRTSSVPCCCSGGDLGSSLKALCRRGFFQARKSWLKTHRIPLAKANRAGRCRCHTEIGFPLRKKQRTLRPGRCSLKRYQVFSLAGIKKYVDPGQQIQGELNFDSRLYIFRDMKTAWMVISGLSCKYCVGMGVR